MHCELVYEFTRYVLEEFALVLNIGDGTAHLERVSKPMVHDVHSLLVHLAAGPTVGAEMPLAAEGRR
jgi:hypothetical protein